MSGWLAGWLGHEVLADTRCLCQVTGLADSQRPIRGDSEQQDRLSSPSPSRPALPDIAFLLV
ncbi:hypothetical protein E2C01_069564 [Portunus trituberculatus]|uniref:Uncharacterized protein n=1 Tax=Portunus trituberculatus TaxID=210409 RepID=A0A5B7HRW2_PORTR|nr:hypothetical protein [Portunus trituberculatus]